MNMDAAVESDLGSGDWGVLELLLEMKKGSELRLGTAFPYM
jgi:hypothetical protein